MYTKEAKHGTSTTSYNVRLAPRSAVQPAVQPEGRLKLETTPSTPFFFFFTLLFAACSMYNEGGDQRIAEDSENPSLCQDDAKPYGPSTSIAVGSLPPKAMQPHGEARMVCGYPSVSE